MWIARENKGGLVRLYALQTGRTLGMNQGTLSHLCDRAYLKHHCAQGGCRVSVLVVWPAVGVERQGQRAQLCPSLVGIQVRRTYGWSVTQSSQARLFFVMPLYGLGKERMPCGVGAVLNVGYAKVKRRVTEGLKREHELFKSTIVPWECPCRYPYPSWRYDISATVRRHICVQQWPKRPSSHPLAKYVIMGCFHIS